MASATVKEKKIKKDKDAWLSFSYEQYALAAKESIHFSTKAVNSNAEAGGVRLCANDAIDLPYISVSTYLPELVALDYMKNGGQTARIAKQLNAVLNDTADTRFSEIPLGEQDLIKAALHSIKGVGAALIGDIDCRLKQVIMSDAAGNSLCLTPLHCAGLSQVINSIEQQQLAECNDDIIKNNASATLKSEVKPELNRLFSRAIMNYGGANAQNVGGLINQMQKPLFFSPPREDRGAKKALAMHYNGIDFVVFAVIDEFLTWRDKFVGNRLGAGDREKERVYMRRMAALALKSGEDAKRYLAEYEHLLPNIDGEIILLDSAVSIESVGLINSKQRSPAWREATSHFIAKNIVSHKRKRLCNGKFELVASGLTSDDQGRLASLLKKELLA